MCGRHDHQRLRLSPTMNRKGPRTQYEGTVRPVPSPTTPLMVALHRPGRSFSPHLRGEHWCTSSANGLPSRARADDTGLEGSGERTGGGLANLREEAGRYRGRPPDLSSKTGGSSRAKRRRRSPEQRPKRRRRGRSMDPNCLQNWYMAPNWVSFIMSDPLMAAMVPDGGQPPVLPPQVEVPVGEGTSKDPGSSSKGKKSGTKPKLSNFSNAEDNILVSCWLNVSTDPVAATGQRRSGFWGCVEAAYNSKKEHGHPTRTLRSLEGRWDFIKEQVSKFSGHLTQVRLEHRSGKGPDNEIAEAIKRYNSLEKKPFAVPTTGLF